MSQRVPNYQTDDIPAPPFAPQKPQISPYYEVAELTWENGQLGLHGLSPPLVPAPLKYSSGAGGTLESIVDQATRFPDSNKSKPMDEVVPWFYPCSSTPTMTMDALVPEQQSHPAGVGSTIVGSCSDGKRSRVAPEWSASRSQHLTMNTCGFTSASVDDNSSFGGKPCTKATTIDDHDSICHSDSHMEKEEEDKKQAERKSPVSIKRSRAAAIHNQSERKRRDKINQRMKTLQKLVPNSNKTDKVSMLDEVIEYLKQLQAQVSLMTRMNMPSIILPMVMQQHQLQLSLMSNNNPMGMPAAGLGFLDLNSMNPFLPMTSPFWDSSSSNNHTPFESPPLFPDPMAAFLASSSQPTTIKAYSRMAALFQQMQQQFPPNSK